MEGKQVQVDDIRPAYAAVKVIEKALASHQKERGFWRRMDAEQEYLGAGFSEKDKDS